MARRGARLRRQPSLEDFLPARIASLCFFDGEKIEALADLENSADVLESAIHALLGLEIVDRLHTDLQVLERKERGSLRGQGERERLGGLETRVGDLEADCLRLRNESARVQAHEIDRGEKRLAELEQRFRAEGGERVEQEAELRRSRHELEAQRERIGQDLLELASGQLPLALMQELLDRMARQVAAEDVAQMEGAVLQAIEERDREVVGLLKEQGVSTSGVSAIQARLAEDRRARAMRADVPPYLRLDDDARSQMRFLRNGAMVAEILRLEVLQEQWDDLEQQIVTLDRALDYLPDRATLTEISAERSKVRKALDQAHAQIALFREELERKERDLERARTAYYGALEEEAAILQEGEDGARLIKHAGRAQKTLETFRAAVLKKNLQRIESAVLESFQHLIRKGGFVHGLTIDPERFRITLYGKEGRAMDTRRLSAGERQLLAVSLLWGLARVAGRPLPVVIDTPLGRLDSTHRSHLVSRYFPCASHQVLLLSTDEEIDEESAKILQPYVGRSYQLAYDEATESTRVLEGYFWEQ